MANKLIDVNGLKAFWNKLKAYTATTSTNGLMSTTDKVRLNRLISIIPNTFSFTIFSTRNIYGKCFNTDEISVTSIQGAKIFDIGNGWALHVIKIVESESQYYQVRVGSYNGPAITACSTIEVDAGNFVAMFLIVLPQNTSLTSKYYITY